MIWYFLRVFCSIMGMWGVLWLYKGHRVYWFPDSQFLSILVISAAPVLITLLFKIVYFLFGIDDNPFRKKKE